MCFLVLLYYGLICLGGFNQVNWLTEIKQKFVSLLKAAGRHNAAEQILKTATDNFAETNLAFARNNSGEVYQPTLLDLYLQNQPQIFNNYRQLADKLTLAQSIDTELPEIYKVITPAVERNPQLLELTIDKILRHNGLIQKALKSWQNLWI